MKVLLVGESWVSRGENAVGLDVIGMSSYTEAAGSFMEKSGRYGIDFTYIPGYRASVDFPMTEEQMSQYQVIIISDIGSNSLLLHPKVQNNCERIPNRLRELSSYVKHGGGLLMCGGYMGFSGFMGKAGFGITPLAKVLPVSLLNYDDRIEEPSGVVPQIKVKEHPILEGVKADWPYFLGYNSLKAKEGAVEIASVNENDAFITVWDYGKGRAGIFASDIAPHWAPPAFLDWESYGLFFANYLKWLGHEI
ncbi:cytoplasmic protein [Faecalicatena sp. AGMB00832]|uniref:Cytoplasmic protein n=1 Tax=Faecalicatena faecalis TaxID=2726362 RepID=A0ABS6D949_9FIRM|nr:glutamine amidotransferase [Faecalicatena faecalis]MBU3878133.1 cytoplasmic protein [Faecalicatena faecalis]